MPNPKQTQYEVLFQGMEAAHHDKHYFEANWQGTPVGHSPTTNYKSEQ